MPGAAPSPRAATASNDADATNRTANRGASGSGAQADTSSVRRPGQRSVAEATALQSNALRSDAPHADAAQSDAAPTDAPAGAITLTESWATLAARLPLRGLAAQLAQQSEWVGVDGATIVLRVATRTLSEGAGVERLRVVLEAHFGTAVKLRFEIGKTGDNTAYAAAVSERQARQEAAEQTIMADPFVRDLLDQFGGKIVPDSIRPVTPDTQQGTPS